MSTSSHDSAALTVLVESVDWNDGIATIFTAIPSDYSLKGLWSIQ
jgi:hypothetical protein